MLVGAAVTHFVVPVFRVATSSIVEEAEALSAAPDLTGYRQPADSRIRVTPTPAGGREIYFPPARNVGPAIFGLLFLGMWTFFIVFMIKKHAGYFMPIVFGMVDVLVTALVLQSLFGSLRVTADPGRITIPRRWGPFQRSRTLSAGEIEEVFTKPDMTVNNTLYTDIMIFRRNGPPVSAGSSIKQAREAEWLAAEMARAAGLKPDADAV